MIAKMQQLMIINNDWMRFCNIQNNQGRGKCYHLSQRPRLIIVAEILIFRDITKA